MEECNAFVEKEVEEKKKKRKRRRRSRRWREWKLRQNRRTDEKKTIRRDI